MADRNLNELLKWGIENSTQENGTNGTSGTNGTTPSGATQTPAATGARPIDPEVMAALFGGPSDADLMKAAMEVVSSTDPEVSLDDKLVAFDNLEQLIESLDNANNLSNLSLWTPLLGMLEHDERELRRMAAWCVGTAVQNNEPSQERLFALGGIPPLVKLATSDDEHHEVRRKAIYALSSAVRNYQPAMDVATHELGKTGRSSDKIDAKNMEEVDAIMEDLKAQAKPAA